ncbi:hypothetical protein Goe27_02060 [Bacillus phage vB_BsuM-Goe27]|uniref:Uncharacterized protein n=1 Tax=Bacillus phage vB_BsuM-Goe3 TaxID=1933063 RepID=A0A217ERC9_BPGO3|nr:hypothetical protein HWB07_gp110 [Bacillus phage vB_BsuM-Goe3]APZ82660.1 hypothetical protein Goe3_c19900 [Bacillus phage vB_BsuM-Goe3]QDP43228.1 hypothetical protein Goe7_c02030 [Bacillus phage vB_BveM-Goe7]WCS69576.1 hypothetical protein Goe24_02010 [Bacillus phage vB_BsuM-Goe24]WCS70084.1 hypothetical protein Goe27_02060 [Bacillus phage vB_BsuM-Goe27]
MSRLKNETQVKSEEASIEQLLNKELADTRIHRAVFMGTRGHKHIAFRNTYTPSYASGVYREKENGKFKPTGSYMESTRPDERFVMLEEEVVGPAIQSGETIYLEDWGEVKVVRRARKPDGTVVYFTDYEEECITEDTMLSVYETLNDLKEHYADRLEQLESIYDRLQSKCSNLENKSELATKLVESKHGKAVAKLVNKGVITSWNLS